MKALPATVSLLAAWQAYKIAHGLTWKTATESIMYEYWLKFCDWIVHSGLPVRYIPYSSAGYLPKDLNGNVMQVPSTSVQVHEEGLPTSTATSRTFSKFRLGGLELKNRVVRAAAFDGESESEMISTHVDMAKGGVAMTTVAYCCVNPYGKSFDGQLVMDTSKKPFLQKLTSAVHVHGAAISAQLTHGGSFTDRASSGGVQQVAPSACFNPAGFDFAREMSLEDLHGMKQDFANAALLAKESGFDCIELHVGHGYLLSQFLSPVYNVRTDKYGGSATNRARFPVECMLSCREMVGDDFPIVVKLNMHDGIEGGLELSDALIAAKMFADHKADGLVLTCGYVSRNGFYMLRGNTPQSKLVQALPHTSKKVAMMLFGPLAVPPIPYEDCFLRESARSILKEIGNTIPLCLLGGVNSFSEMEGAINEGFGFVQIARGLIREPDLVNRIQASLNICEKRQVAEMADVVSSCIRCNMCVIATVDPTASFGCPFQRMDVKRRQAQKLPGVFSIEDFEKTLLEEDPNFEKLNHSIKDIEDLLTVKSAGHL